MTKRETTTKNQTKKKKESEAEERKREKHEETRKTHEIDRQMKQQQQQQQKKHVTFRQKKSYKKTWKINNLNKKIVLPLTYFIEKISYIISKFNEVQTRLFEELPKTILIIK